MEFTHLYIHLRQIAFTDNTSSFIETNRLYVNVSLHIITHTHLNCTQQEFAYILQAYLSACTGSCLVGMIPPLIPTLREGVLHKHYPLIRSAFVAFIDGFYFDDENANVFPVVDTLVRS